MIAAALHFGVAALLGFAAWLCGRRGRRVEWSHALWCLTLVALLVPPVVELPVLSPVPVAAQQITPPPISPVSEGGPAEAIVIEEAPLDDVVPRPTFLPAETAAASPSLETARLPVPLPLLLWSLWALGALVSLLLVGRAAFRFQRRLRDATLPPEELRTLIEHRAAILGLSRLPRVRVLPGGFGPAIWPFPRATLVLPADLTDSLSRARMTLLLDHELTHFARRDHWLRIPELLVSCAYWWCPPVAWCRRQLRRNEEASVDRRVLAVTGEGDRRRTYAELLIDMARRTAPSAALATGIGRRSSLAHRLELIMTSTRFGNRPTRLRGAIIAAVLGLLPFLPTPRVTSLEAGSETAAAPVASIEIAGPTPVNALAPEELDPKPTPRDEKVMAEVNALMAEGKKADALLRLQQAEKEEPSPVLALLRAHLQLSLQNKTAALSACRDAVSGYPSFADAWRLRALLTMQSEDPEECILAHRRLIELGAASTEEHGRLGMMLFRAKRLDEAAQYLRMAMALDPAGGEWHELLINLLMRQKKHGEALSTLEAVLARTPDDPELMLMRILILTRLDRPESTRAALDVLRARNDLSRNQNVGCGKFELQVGRPEMALEFFRRTLTASPPATAEERASFKKMLRAFGGPELAERLDAPVAPPQVERELTRPVALKTPAPVLSAELKRHTPAAVTVVFQIDKNGRVQDAKITESTDARFATVTLDAIRRWTFRPARRDGKPIRVRHRQRFNYPAPKTTTNAGKK